MLRDKRSAERSFKKQYDIVIEGLADDDESYIDGELKLLNTDFENLKITHGKVQSFSEGDEYDANELWFEIIEDKMTVLKGDIRLWKRNLRDLKKVAASKERSLTPEVSPVPQPKSSSFLNDIPTDIISNEEEATSSQNYQAAKKQTSNETPNRTSTFLVPKNQNSAINETLCRLLEQQGAPDVTIDKFDGNPLEYKYFISTFMEAVDSKVCTDRGRLLRLNQHLEGEQKELVRHCIQEPPSLGYRHALQLLKDQYGDPYRVFVAYRQELQQLPAVNPDDGAAFRSFYGHLLKCKTSMTSKDYIQALDSPEFLRTLQLKLPSRIQDRWNRTAMRIRDSYNIIPNFDDFTNFVKDEMKLVNDPMFSREAAGPISYDRASRPDASRRRGGFRSNATGVDKDQPTASCPMCNSTQHDLDDCGEFLQLDSENRKKYVFNHRLCFCCLQPNHTARECRSKKTCKVCRMSHPTSLHAPRRRLPPTPPAPPSNAPTPPPKTDDKIDNVEHSFSNKCTDIHENSVSVSVVPVWLYHSSNPTKKVSTYALLDSCSQGSFVTEDIMNDLNLNGISTTITIKTLNKETSEPSSAVNGLVAQPYFEVDGCKNVTLPKLFSRKNLPTEPGEIPTRCSLAKYTYLEDLLQYVPVNSSKLQFGILIGVNCVRALEPLEVVNSEGNGPYAYKTRLGWCITGPKSCRQNGTINCRRTSITSSTKIKEESLKDMMMQMYQHDFNESDQHQPSLSVEDRRFIRIMDTDAKLQDSHYVLPVPFRSEDLSLPNNRSQAFNRAMWLKKKLERGDQFRDDYVKFMQELLSKEYVVKCEEPPTEGKVWYVPHHGVYHPQKPGKIRVVFDCSASFSGRCLNKEILQGPDLINSLVGVLCRFRSNNVAFMGDIEKMYYQVRLPKEHQDFFRILWWPNGDTNQKLQEYRMTVHLQGCISSPSCANYALKRTAEDNKADFDDNVVQMLKRNFYVDDLLGSKVDDKTASKAITDVKALCKRGGFNLLKFLSNSRVVMNNIDNTELAKSVKDLDLSNDELPCERALGVTWFVDDDTIGFKISFKEKPPTRRGILATISSIYDPLGLASPFLLVGRLILQQLVKDQFQWDEEIPNDRRIAWERWKEDLQNLQSKVPRCFKPPNFGEIVYFSLHTFCDASDVGYGVASYLRLENTNGDAAVNLAMGKSRVAPIKYVTTPRMELTAAVLAVRIAKILLKEFTFPDLETFFWTDSKAVLGYISNEARRFHTFVANRTQVIRDSSDIKDWFHIDTDDTPADDASRGLSTSDYDKVDRWFFGPRFLKLPKSDWPIGTEKFDVALDDPEVKINVMKTEVATPSDSITNLLNRVSSWFKIKRIIATILLWHQKKSKPLTTEIIQAAELKIIKHHQQTYFYHEIQQLTRGKLVNKTSNLYNLNPFVDNLGILRVGGRLKQSTIEFKIKHPIIISNKGPLASLIIRWFHLRTNHCGRVITINSIRTAGFWIIRCTSLVKSAIFKCVTCRKIRWKPSTQQMSDLPGDRIAESAPFTYSGVDVFGPFTIKDGRKRPKRYGLLFTCCSSRAIHLESIHTLETDSFIQGLRRLISRRGNVRVLRSDRGTNFSGADNELQALFNQMDHDRIQSFMQINGGDWLIWKFNPPKSSHMGGVWERQIRSVRSILSNLMNHHGDCVDDESFRTFLCEAECIVNSRPLTYDNIGDPQSPIPISPITLLTGKSQLVLPPPGNFTSSTTMYCRQRWRRVQHLANEFWTRWRKEYLSTLQERRKWPSIRRNLSVGDVVLLKDGELFRNDWNMGIVLSTKQSADGLVRSCTLKTKSGTLERPIHKLVLLLESE